MMLSFKLIQVLLDSVYSTLPGCAAPSGVYLNECFIHIQHGEVVSFSHCKLPVLFGLQDEGPIIKQEGFSYSV